MESERECLHTFAVHDTWAHQFPDRDPPGYTRTSLLKGAADGRTQCLGKLIAFLFRIAYSAMPFLCSPRLLVSVTITPWSCGLWA